MRCSDKLIEILEEHQIKHIFGHPGEQILTFYDSLSQSNIKHILTRHEQAAIHAADGYSRSTGDIGVCVSTAGPGASNLIMGMSVAYKDHIPLLVITGDNDTDRDINEFQSLPLNDMFRPISYKTYNPQTAEEAIQYLNEALYLLENLPLGPIHFNLPKNISKQEVLDGGENFFFEGDNFDYSGLEELIIRFKNSEKPLIVAGNGVFWSHTGQKLRNLVNKHFIPIVTTFHSKGILSEDNKYNLGMTGIRGTEAANFAARESDFILVLGAELNERTLEYIDLDKVVHVNINKDVLKGSLQIHGSVTRVIDSLHHVSACGKTERWTRNRFEWLGMVDEYPRKYLLEGDPEDNEGMNSAFIVKHIFDRCRDGFCVGDAGSHTTWFTVLRESVRPGQFVFSGGLAPMGYGLPAGVGVSVAHPGEVVVVVTGDGAVQMTIEELATIRAYDLPVVVCVLNNSQLGIIRQWQDLSGYGNFSVDLDCVDFSLIGEGYGVPSECVVDVDGFVRVFDEAVSCGGPFLIDVRVVRDDIPLPGRVE